MDHLARRFLVAALVVLAAGAVFSAVCAIIWPVHYPVWATRASSAGLLCGVTLTAVGASIWAIRK